MISLLQLLKTCECKIKVRIVFGSEDNRYFDIAADQKQKYTEYLEWVYKADVDIYNDLTPDIDKWDIQSITTSTEYTKDGDCIETKEDILVIYLE